MGRWMKDMNKYIITSLSVAGGILMALAWTDWCSGLILLIGLVPFLLMENALYENREKYHLTSFFIYLLPGFVIFNILTLGWVRIASILAAITVILEVSFLMAFTMWLAHVVRLKTGNIAGFISLLAFWLTFEFLCLNIDLLSPWVNLGNGLSKDILFIQWYEASGVGGGTLWILTSNLLVAILLIKLLKRQKGSMIIAVIWLLTFIIPSIISFARFYMIKPSEKKISEVLIIQPNVDPYTEKFIIPFEEQLGKVLEMAGREVTENTEWVITPETTVDDPINVNDLHQNGYISMIKEFIALNPGVCMITGMVSYSTYEQSSGALENDPAGGQNKRPHAKYFNSAFKIDTGKSIEIYHKSKLVAGVENQLIKVPDGLMNRIFPNMGGTKGYEIQKERTCFTHSGTGESAAPVICYESVFGKYVTEYVKEGANAIFIITNDGWWKNTNGFKHHLSYASLRAIETRRPVARAANTGISCLIDFKGRITQKTGWWTRETLKGRIIPEEHITFYSRHGDYIMIISFFISIIIFLFVFIIKPVIKKYG